MRLDTMTASNNDPKGENNKEGGHCSHASVSQTAINMAKTCMGTGCLALPFAAKQGGILLHVFGLLAVGIWNVITVQRLEMCYHLVIEPCSHDAGREETTMDLHDERLPLKQSSRTAFASEDSMQSYQSLPQEGAIETDDNNPHNNNNDGPPKGTTTLVRLAWYALGPWGANLLDAFMVLYLVGVIVTYINAMRSFLSDTFLTSGIGFVDSFGLVAVMAPLVVVPHTGKLARISAMGLLVLLATFVVIAWYGFFSLVPPDDASTGHKDVWHVLTGDASATHAPTTTREERAFTEIVDSCIWLPQQGIAGVSQWFGIAVFGFGVAPLAFNFRQGMREPQHLVKATWWALLSVSGAYIVIGLGLLYPFPHIDGDLLTALPPNGPLPTLTRLAMVVVVLVTAPLLIVPCGEIVEGKIMGSLLQQQAGQCNREERATEEEEEYHHHMLPPSTEWRLNAGVRWSICLVCAAISTFVPGFVNVLSFVGCCCVAVVGFCVPPFLHLILSLKKARSWSHSQPLVLGTSSRYSVLFDLALLVWGLLATGVSTVYTFKEVSSG